MLQAALLDCQFLDLLPFPDDSFVAPEVDISWCDVVQALVVSLVVVKWSGKFGQRAKMYPTRMNGYENDEATELFRQV